MRALKIRGKRVDGGKWISSEKFSCSPSATRIIVSSKDSQDRCLVEKDTVGLFTGFTDSRDREIYDGDILECLGDDGPFPVAVSFRDGAFHVDIVDGVNGADFTCLLADLFKHGEVRVVGNIWDGYPKFVTLGIDW